MDPVLNQPIELSNGKYITPLAISGDGTITLFSTNIVTDGLGNPTQVTLNPGMTLAALLSLLGVTPA